MTNAQYELSDRAQHALNELSYRAKDISAQKGVAQHDICFRAKKIFSDEKGLERELLASEKLLKVFTAKFIPYLQRDECDDMSQAWRRWYHISPVANTNIEPVYPCIDPKLVLKMRILASNMPLAYVRKQAFEHVLSEDHFMLLKGHGLLVEKYFLDTRKGEDVFEARYMPRYTIQEIMRVEKEKINSF